MRTPRAQLFSATTPQTVLVSNRMAADMPVFNFEDRAMLRSFFEQSAHEQSFELLAWCYLPTAYRLIVRGRLDPPKAVAPDDNRATQTYPLARMVKSALVRLGHWRNFRKVESLVWPERFHAAALTTPGQQLAGAISIDAYPLLTGVAAKPEDYYFGSFHDACAGNETARKGIGQLIGEPSEAWPEICKKYRRLLEKAHQQVAEQTLSQD